MGGGRLTVGRVLNEKESMEFTAMGFNHNSDSLILDPVHQDISAVWEDTGGGFLPAGLFGIGSEFEEAFSQSIDYDTRFISAELNHRIHLNRMFSTIHGIRYAYFGDDLHFLSEDGFDDPGILNIDGNNHMIGIQIGADMDIPLTDRLSANGGVKVGGFLNVATTDLHMFDMNGNSYQFDDTDVRGSAITEGNLGLSFNVTENVSLSLGYMAMLLSWVTTAGEQFPQTNTAQEFQKHNNDHVLVHGPLARINMTFP